MPPVDSEGAQAMMFRARAAMAAGILAVAGVMIGGAAPPQIRPEGRAQVLERLVECRKITEAAQRLSCYDAAAAALDQAEAKGDIVVVDRAQARKVRRQAFGFHVPSITLFERGETEEEISTITGTIDRAGMNGGGKWVFTLKDGGVWVQIDSNSLMLDPRPGQTVKIRRATLGSYLLTVNGQAIRVHRAE
jgi:hypothetical protein